MQTVEAPYYLGINHSKDSSKCWFKGSPMGVNKLTSLMKTMAGKAGCERRLTNHSAQKQMMQKPWTITMFLQHTSCSSLVTEIYRGLKITALCQKSSRKICRWFWATIKTSQTVATAESSFSNSSVIPASGAFRGAVFHEGHFNITINTLNKSQNTSKCSVSTVARSYRRIKRVLDSSHEYSPPAVPLQWQFLSKLFYW